jgi:hypothetical protein
MWSHSEHFCLLLLIACTGMSTFIASKGVEGFGQTVEFRLVNSGIYGQDVAAPLWQSRPYLYYSSGRARVASSDVAGLVEAVICIAGRSPAQRSCVR